MSIKGQITVPREVRDFLGVGDSDKLTFTPIEDGELILSQLRSSARALFKISTAGRLPC